MNPKHIIAMDVDEVCADLHTEWLYRYNLMAGDTMLPENVKSWEIEKYVKSGWESRIFDILEDPHLYDRVMPMPNARSSIYELLAAGFRVVYVSSCYPGTEGHKRDWLVRWGFLTKKNAMLDFVATPDKSLIHAGYLFDDRPENLHHFRGVGVLMDRPHNRHADWQGFRIADLRDALNIVRMHL